MEGFALAYMGAGIGLGLAVIGAGLGIGRLAAGLAEGIARQPSAVAQLWRKCTSASSAQFSNTDNMALVGILSTQLAHEVLVRRRPEVRGVELRTRIDRTAGV